MQEQQRSGIHYLEAATSLLQRVRRVHPTAGLLEAADLQWWWRTPRSTDGCPQLFWVDELGRPEAAVIATDWGGAIALDPIVMPTAAPDWLAYVMERGLAHAAELGLQDIDVVTEGADHALSQALSSRGFVSKPDSQLSVVVAWLAVDARPSVSSLRNGYRLCSRLDTMQRQHHMSIRSGAEVEARLRQTSLYRPELDLLILDQHDQVAAYGLFWVDPETRVGLVEPMRTESDHRQRGLARHILTAGVDLLAQVGAARVKLCFRPDNAAAQRLYLGAGFKPGKQTAVLSRKGQPGAA